MQGNDSVADVEKINLCGKLECKTDFIKKVTKEVAEKLKNYEEFVAKKQIESDNLQLMN